MFRVPYKVTDQTLFRPKLCIGRERTSSKRRLLVQTIKEQQDLAVLLALYKTQRRRALLGLLLSGESSSWSRKVRKVREVLLERILQAGYYDVSRHIKIKRGTRTPTCVTIEGALQCCSLYHGHQRFAQMFLFTYDEMRRVTPMLFPSSLRVYKRGSFATPTELMILVTARLRNTFTSCEALGEFMGRDAGWVSDYYFAALKDLDTRLGSLISMDHLGKWVPHLELWNAALEVKLMEQFGSEMFGRFRGANCVLDGVRQYVCTPLDKEWARELINPYLGNHATFVYMGLVAPNGLIIALGDPISGSQNDTGAALHIQLEERLAEHGLVALCDSIFAHTPSQRPIPKESANMHYTGEQLTAISRLRISVEWSFGSLLIRAPFLKDVWKQKAKATAPTLSFRMAALLVNFKTCCCGTNGNKYFGLETIEPEEYYGMRV